MDISSRGTGHIERSEWQRLVEVALALARIRELRPKREEFGWFEGCGRKKWEDGERYLSQLMAAVQWVRRLGASGSQPKPEPH